MATAIYGVSIGEGIAIGRIHILKQNNYDDIPNRNLDSEEEVEKEIQRFEKAILLSRKELEQLRNNIPENAPAELGTFISLHLMLLNDAHIARDPIDLIEEQKINAEWALQQQVAKISQQFDNITDEYLSERKQDILQITERIFKNLVGQNNYLQHLQHDLFDDIILVATDLSPEDTFHFENERIVAFATDSGSLTSHTSILGRNLNIPSVVALKNACNLVHENEWCILDGIDGVLILDADEFIIEEYKKRQREYRARKKNLEKIKNSSTTTLDNVDIEIHANIADPKDMTEVNKNSADGVGLFRTEFLFMNRDTLPSEDEQYSVYSKVVKKANGKPVVIRTMDLGGDKNANWIINSNEKNPSMGLIGVRLSLAEPMMFHTQMRAILRASVHGDVRIMWPMISSVTEIRQCLSHLQRVKDELKEKNKKFDENIKTGIMIETPAAALVVGTLLKHTDFISIGTNDLIQYVLATDRYNNAVSYLYQPTNPAIIKLLLHIYRNAKRLNKPVSICGEIANDESMTRLLLGIGFRNFSVPPANMLKIKEVILSSDIKKISSKITPILRNDNPEKAITLLEKLNN